MPDLAQLRARIGALEGLPSLAAGRSAEAVPLGVAAIDDCLPWGGLATGGLHEVRAESADAAGAAMGFAAYLLGRLARARRGRLLWLTLSDHLHAPGLAGLGVPVDRLLVVRPVRTADLLWAAEEGLRCKGVAGLLADIDGADFKAARRLSLAARGSGVPGLLLNRGAVLGASLTRWQVAPAPSEAPREFGAGVGAWRWHLALTRCRFMAAGDEDRSLRWLVEAKHAKGGFSLVALSGDRSFGEARERRQTG
jgi:protein ImuA